MNYKMFKNVFLCGICISLLFGCQSSNEESEIITNVETLSSQVTYDSDDAYHDYTSENPEMIDLDEQSGDLEIKEAGTYVLSGTLDGSVKITVDKEETVRLVLDNASIKASDYSAIYCSQAKKLIISLKEGTVNSLSDELTYTNVVDEEPSATLFAKDDLTINGSGTLNIEANVNDAITSKDTLKLMEGTYQIKAVDDGIVGRDFVYIHDGEYVVEVQGDGIKTTYDTDTEKGDMMIENGKFNITSGADAIQAIQDLSIYDGDYEIVSGGGSVNASTSANANQPGGFGRWNESNLQQSSDTPSAKGIKGGASVMIAAGIYSLDTSDDAIHSNGTADITGGNLTIQSGDDGIHADGMLTINDGSINVSKSYEGLEGSSVHISGGNILVVASDDGINAAGGSDEESSDSGVDTFYSTEDHTIQISGGTTQVDAMGDGLDSNKTITMSGGVIVVSGPTNEGNGALDFDGDFTITGGIMIATGSNGMVQSPSVSSQQNTLVINTGNQEANATFYISDADGNIILGVSPSKAYGNVIVSSPKLMSGSTYHLYTNATGGSVNDAGYIESGVEGGTLLETFTLENTITNIGTMSGMGQGGMPQGGGEQRP